MLHNIGIICPVLGVFAVNCYSVSARLFVIGGKEIRSKEGTTQGDPIAMALYAISTKPLLDCVISQMINYSSVKNVAYADDLNGTGELNDLLEWWKCVCDYGPVIGYFTKPSKSWLVVKPELADEAEKIFMGTQINVTVEGRKHLGAAIGSEEYKTKFMKAKIIEWVDEIRNLSQIAKIDPHAAYSAFTHGLRHRYTYTFRTIPNIKHLLQPLEDEIKDNFLPSLTNNHLCSEDERKLLALPPKMGGLGIIIPTEIVDKEFQNSDELTKLLQKNIIEQNQIYIPVDSKKLKNKIRAEKELRNKSNLDKLLEKGTEKVKKCVENFSTKWSINMVKVEDL